MKLALFAAAAAIVTALTTLAAAPDAGAHGPEEHAWVKGQLRDVDERIGIVRQDDGSYGFQLHHHDGSIETLDPNAFAARVHHEQARRPWAMVVLNITSWAGVAWVALGLTGQVLFTGRMLIQWLASERSKASVVPTAFWWMSLAGASMLIVYFVWRKDIIGILGQSTGWTIYIRNLWFIHARRPHQPTIVDDPGPEPELSYDPSDAPDR